MPGMDGLAMLSVIHEERPDIPVIIISGAGSIDDAIKSLRLGAWDYLTKPIIDLAVLEHTVVRCLERAALIEQRREYQENLKVEVKRRTAELELQGQHLMSALVDTVAVVATMGEKRDPYTAGHERRVAGLARAIAREMGLSEHATQGLYLAASIHDLGKICIPSEILAKPGKLTDIEFSLLKTHAQVGYDILKDVKFPWPVAQLVHQHHERIDGSGYPLGISGDDLPPESRILQVADVTEAMASHRPYRPALGVDRALDQLRQGKGSRYDPDVVDTCIALFRDGAFEFSA